MDDSLHQVSLLEANSTVDEVGDYRRRQSLCYRHDGGLSQAVSDSNNQKIEDVTRCHGKSRGHPGIPYTSDPLRMRLPP